jgi:hypothetical protein
MAEKPDASASEHDYQSTPEDRRRAWILGVVYIILAIFLAWMLFKIWPPTPWPTSKELTDNPELARELKEAECPGPCPQATATAAPTVAPANTQGASLSPTVRLSASATVSPTATSIPTATPTGSTQTLSQGNGPVSSPSPSPSATAPPPNSLINIPINFFWGKWCYKTSFDERLILLVIIAGMLGSFVHGATSLADFIGNNKFNKNWTWFYLLRPAIGMALALVFYFVIRGGFLTTSGGAKDINPYGIAALAGMVGMFSKQATDKLSEVFGTLFRSKPGEGDDKRSGPLKPDAKAITITGVDPKGLTAASSANQTIKVTGTNFVNGSKVVLEQTTPPATIATTTTFVGANELSAKLGSANLLAQTYQLKVVNPDNTESPKVDFVVT